MSANKMQKFIYQWLNLWMECGFRNKERDFEGRFCNKKKLKFLRIITSFTETLDEH